MYKKMTRVINLLFSLPDVLMTEVFEFDNTYRIFGSLKFKKDLHYGWLKKQSSYAKRSVIDLINDYIYDDEDFMFKNEYCCIGGPSDAFFKDNVYGKRIHIKENDDFMVYVSEPKNDVLYFKILPKELDKKLDKKLLENMRFDGFFCHMDNELLNMSEIDKSLYHKDCAPIDCDIWYTTSEGQQKAPFMYRNTCCWF